MTELSQDELRSLHGGARITNPLCIGYNIAVRAMTRRIFTTGYDTVSNINEAPTSLEELNEVMNGGKGRMIVWDGACDRTIFDCPETNQDFRAWHDWAHWVKQAPFTLDGEVKAIDYQCENLITVHGDTDEVAYWRTLLRTDIVGTFAHREITGDYPEDQRAWTEHLLAGLEKTL